ncbi:MAG: hypothetical protein EBU93_01110 [Chlamydiae bacterium]|nr:hypothetical protein [Chlamydiota bacterium]
MKNLFLLLCSTVSAFVFGYESNEAPAIKEDAVSIVYVGGYGGYGSLNGMYRQFGKTAMYRFSFGVDAYRSSNHALSFEGGIQSGNMAPVKGTEEVIYESGGMIPQIVLKPFIDLLAVYRYTFMDDYLFIAKLGAAYRQLQFVDRTTIKGSLNRLNFEFQIGLGYNLTKHARIVGLYQGIYSESNGNLRLASNADVYMRHIPTQQAGLFGIEYSF